QIASACKLQHPREQQVVHENERGCCRGIDGDRRGVRPCERLSNSPGGECAEGEVGDVEGRDVPAVSLPHPLWKVLSDANRDNQRGGEDERGGDREDEAGMEHLVAWELD